MPTSHTSNRLTQVILGQSVQWQNRNLLSQALTHRSVGKNNNERLEFLGDSILGLVITRWLYNQYTQLNEGSLSRLRSQLVNGKTLAEVARYYQLGESIKLGDGEIKSGGADKRSVLADAVEAVFGAYYLDQGFEKTQQFILKVMHPWLKKVDPVIIKKDAKSMLQEYLQQNGFELPIYSILHSIEDADRTEFHVRCFMQELNIKVEAIKSSRKKAEQSAAEHMLDILHKKRSV